MSDIPTIGGTTRLQLPNRRESLTQTITFLKSDGQQLEYQATVGFDQMNRPREIFLFGAKDGSDMAAVLIDASVALSVALQSGVSATAMSRSVGRVGGEPVSIIGAALELLASHEATI